MRTSAGATRPHGSPELAALRVADVMHEGVYTCPLETPLRDVARMMVTHRVHCVVAAEENDDGDGRSLWGVISDLDLVAAAGARDIDERTAGGTAATPVLQVAPDETLDRAAQLMTEHGVTHLVAVDPVDGRPAGVVSTLDIAGVLAGDEGEERP